MDLEYVKNQRGLSFVKKGMKVQSIYNGKFGVIKGGNSSGNLDVIFDGKKRADNCHPTWQMRYFDKNGNVIAEYKD